MDRVLDSRSIGLGLDNQCKSCVEVLGISTLSPPICAGQIPLLHVLNVFIDIQTSKELIQMDTNKMMTYGTFTMDDEKLTQS